MTRHTKLLAPAGTSRFKLAQMHIAQNVGLAQRRKDPTYPNCACCAGAVSLQGAFCSEQYVLHSKWSAFWNLRQLKPAWASSSEAIQLYICLEKSKVIWPDSTFKGCHGQPTRKMKRPDDYFDCVLELTVPCTELRKKTELVEDLEACATQDFGGSFKTW